MKEELIKRDLNDVPSLATRCISGGKAGPSGGRSFKSSLKFLEDLKLASNFL